MPPRRDGFERGRTAVGLRNKRRGCTIWRTTCTIMMVSSTWWARARCAGKDGGDGWALRHLLWLLVTKYSWLFRKYKNLRLVAILIVALVAIVKPIFYSSLFLKIYFLLGGRGDCIDAHKQIRSFQKISFKIIFIIWIPLVHWLLKFYAVLYRVWNLRSIGKSNRKAIFLPRGPAAFFFNFLPIRAPVKI